MDGVLREFLEESGFRSAGEGGREKRMNGKAKGKGKSMDGVWVRCRPSGTDDKNPGEVGCEGDEKGTGECGDTEDEENEQHEEDEMIWWCWDGKIVGFSDW